MGPHFLRSTEISIILNAETLLQTDFDKRQFAMKSHEFNLKDKVYCDLFPDLVVASQTIVEERKVNQVSESFYSE